MSIAASDFFSRLDALRRTKHEKIVDVARICGISPPAVQGWKNGKMPTIDNLRLLAQHYGVTVDWLVAGRDDATHQRETSSTRHPDGTHSDAVVREVGPPYIPFPSEWPGSAELKRIDTRLANIERLLVKLAGEQS